MPNTPRNEADLPQWLQNFAIKFPVHGTALGFIAAEVTATVDDCNALIYILGTGLDAARNFLQQITAYKNLIKEGTGTAAVPFPAFTALPAAPSAVLPGALNRIKAIIARIKKMPAYTDAIGQDLDIISATSASPAPDSAPTFTVRTAVAGNVVFDWVKGSFDGVVIESRQSGAANWTSLGTDLYSPFADTRPLAAAGQPEMREYRMKYLLGDQPFGEWSTTALVTVQVS